MDRTGDKERDRTGYKERDRIKARVKIKV